MFKQFSVSGRYDCTIPRVSVPRMNEAFGVWDAGLIRLVEGEMARQVGDIRACLVSEIARAMADRGPLCSADPDKLAEVAVDALIEFSRNAQFGGNYPAGGARLM